MPRALLVEDERLAREELSRLLAAHPEIEVVGQAASVASARRALDELRPDLLFLDVQLADGNGFELLEGAPPELAVVLVTAFDRYAVRAFEVAAVDYLLKPVDPERLAQCLRRLSSGARAAPPPLSPLPSLSLDDRLFLKLTREWRFVAVSELSAILAEGDYSRVVCRDGGEALVLRPLRDWERCLPPRRFERVHRGALVSLAAVARVEERPGPRYLVHLHGSRRSVQMSRRQATRLRAAGLEPSRR